MLLAREFVSATVPFTAVTVPSVLTMTVFSSDDMAIFCFNSSFINDVAISVLLN